MLRTLLIVISLILSMTSSYKMKMKSTERERSRNKIRSTTRILSFAYDDDDSMVGTEVDVGISDLTKALSETE